MDVPHTVYCDESGNDGPNFLSSDQPFYVLAGWVSPDTAIVEASVAIEKLRLECCKQSQEVKFRLLRNKMRAVCDTIGTLCDLGLTPVYVVAEKRFCIAAKIVETFLDPAYNAKLSDAFTADLYTKRELANTFYDRLPQETLESFARAYRNPTPDGLRTVLPEVAKACKACVNTEIAEIIEGSLASVEEIAEAETAGIDTFGKGMGTINLPCLIAFLMHLEAYANRHEIECRIVHDEQAVYEADYKQAYRLFHRPGGEPLLLEGMRVPFGPLQTIVDFEMQGSVQQPMVQAADMLAGSLNFLSRKLLSNEELHPLESELARRLLPVLFIGDPELSLLVCSSKVQKGLRSAVAEIVPEVRFNVDESIAGMTAVSTLPDGEHLPLFPAIAPQQEQFTFDRKFAVDLPLFGLVDSAEGRLCILIPPDMPLDATTRDQRCVPLWTTKQTAADFLESMKWSAPHDIVEFGCPELGDLLGTLHDAYEWTDKLALFPADGEPHLIPVSQFISEMGRIIERIRRAAISGVTDSLLKEHTVCGERAVSMLLSSGEYAASLPPYGKLFRAASRDAAVSLLEEYMRSNEPK